MNDSLLIHGPQGCGKSRFAPQLAAHFGLTRTVELEEAPEALRPKGTLYLTNLVNEVRGNKIRTLAFSAAASQAGLAVRS